jgi:hypothetical protein
MLLDQVRAEALRNATLNATTQLPHPQMPWPSPINTPINCMTQTIILVIRSYSDLP